MSSKGFGGACLDAFKDKLVEINTGEVRTSLYFSDWEQNQKHVIRGIVIDASDDALVVECGVHGKKRNVLINCWSIISIMAVEEGDNVGIKDIYTDDENRSGNRR